MKVGKKRSVRLPGYLGIGFLAISIAGMVLVVGTLVTLRGTQEALIEKTIEQYASILNQSGLPEEFVDRFKLEAPITETVEVALDDDQKRLLRQAQRVLVALKEALSKAVEKSRHRSKIGVAVCAVGVLVGLLLVVFGIKRKGESGKGGAESNEPGR